LALRPIASRQTRKVKVINGHNDETKQGIHKIIRTLATILGCAVVAAVGGLAFIYSGIYEVSATTPDNPVVTWVVDEVSDTSVRARLGGNHPPGDFDTPEKVMAGGQLHSQSCAICQGGPGPPDLFRADRKPDPAENFQFIKYGIKMKAMLGFGPSCSDEKIWSLVALLNGLPGISITDFAAKTAAVNGG
jgi:hypothetical protein